VHECVSTTTMIAPCGTATQGTIGTSSGRQRRSRRPSFRPALGNRVVARTGSCDLYGARQMPLPGPSWLRRGFFCAALTATSTTFTLSAAALRPTMTASAGQRRNSRCLWDGNSPPHPVLVQAMERKAARRTRRPKFLGRWGHPWGPRLLVLCAGSGGSPSNHDALPGPLPDLFRLG
jgi:hypothetical protein